MARVGNRRMANWKSTGLTRHLPLKRSWNLFAAAAKDRAKHDAVLVSAMAFPARRHAHAKIPALTVLARTIAKMMIAMVILTVMNMKANLGFLFPVSRPRKQTMLFATHWFRTHCIESVINHVHYHFHTVYLINDENKVC